MQPDPKSVCHGCGYEFRLETNPERITRWHAQELRGEEGQDLGVNWFCPDHDNPKLPHLVTLSENELLEEVKGYHDPEKPPVGEGLVRLAQNVRWGMGKPYVKEAEPPPPATGIEVILALQGQYPREEVAHDSTPPPERTSNTLGGSEPSETSGGSDDQSVSDSSDG